MTIGKRITMLRKQNNLTQTDLAQKIYVSPKTVSKWENDYGLPDIKIIPLLAEALQVDADYLLTGKSKIPAAFSLAQPKEKPPAPESEYDPNAYRLAIYQVTHNHLSVWLLFINVFTVILALIGSPIEVKMLNSDDFSPFTILTAVYPSWGSMGNSGPWEIAIALFWLLMIAYILITSFLFLRATLNGTNEYYLTVSGVQFAGVAALFVLSFVGSVLTNLYGGEILFRLNLSSVLLLMSTFLQFLLVFLVSRHGKVLHRFKSFTAIAILMLIALSAAGLTVPQTIVASELDPSSVSCSEISYVLAKNQVEYVDVTDTYYSGETLLAVRANRKVDVCLIRDLVVWLDDQTPLYAQTDAEFLRTSYKKGDYLNFFSIDYRFVTFSESAIDRIELSVQFDGASQEFSVKTRSIQIYEEASPDHIKTLGTNSGNLDWENKFSIEESYAVFQDMTITGYRCLNAQQIDLSCAVGKEDNNAIRYEPFYTLQESGANQPIGPSSGNGKQGWFALAFSIRQVNSLTPFVIVELHTTAGNFCLRFALDHDFIIRQYLAH